MISMHSSLSAHQRGGAENDRNRRHLRVWRSPYPIIFGSSSDVNPLIFFTFSFVSGSKRLIELVSDTEPFDFVWIFVVACVGRRPISCFRLDPEALSGFRKESDELAVRSCRVRLPTLKTVLANFNATVRDGLIVGNRMRDASMLRGLPILVATDILPFNVPEHLPVFIEDRAERPRSRQVFEAPLLLVKEFFRNGPRPVAAVALRDMIFTDAFFGASLPADHRWIAQCLATVLSSSFASWFFLMTASEFGVWKRCLHVHDVVALPVPDLGG